MEYLGLYVLLGGIVIGAWGIAYFTVIRPARRERRHLKNLK